MKKLTFYFFYILIFFSCSTIKYVPKGKFLLTKNNIFIDSTKTNNAKLNSLLLQKPNAKALGLPLSLYFYNIGNPEGSKDLNEWKNNNPKFYNTFKKLFSEKQSISIANGFVNFNNWFLTNGQKPSIINKKKTINTQKNLKTYFQTQGFFRTKVYSIENKISKKKATISYFVEKGKPSFLNKIQTNIKSKTLDSIYKKNVTKSLLKSGEQYNDNNFKNEASRIVKLYRNKGIYHFSENNILFEPDSTKNYKKINVKINISDRLIEKKGKYYKKPFRIQKIQKINIFTDYYYNTRNEPFKSKKTYKGINFYSHGKLKYNPKLLSESIFIKPNQAYTDSLRYLTKTHLRSLKNFKFISIHYKELNDDNLETNIFLTPTEKYTFRINTELARSNIRNFDISTALSIINRNTFKGAETFQLSLSGSYFNSNNGPGLEIGANLTLVIPRFILAFGLHNMIPKKMFPKTRFFLGISIQKNIALDKKNISIGIDYKWKKNKHKNFHIEFFNTQYIRNLNVQNYFNIYNSEYRKLNLIAKNYYNDKNYNLKIPNETLSFMKSMVNNLFFKKNNHLLYKKISNILNRYNIITSDFLIPVIAYSYIYNNRINNFSNNYSFFKIRIANSGNFLDFLSNKKNKTPIAQYFKTDLEYKKFWEINKNSVLAHRTFLGAIFTYNKSNIPFSKSYFAGGSNDIRAWRTYNLGPGKTTNELEYNIGSLKFLSSLEYRFNLIGNFKSAFFIDIGNIWDITNSNFINKNAKFNNIKSLRDIAVGSGFGLRYDFKLLVGRIDIGFKTREPYLKGNKWFKNFNFSKAIYNIGINYPF